MQFLPTSTSSNVSALGGVSLSVSSGVSAIFGEANAFLDSLNQELSASGVTPVVDSDQVNGPPSGFRTIGHDPSAKINGEDVSGIVAALRKKGVHDSALEGLEQLLASGQTMTLGSITGALAGRGRKGEDLTDGEMEQLGGVLRKMRFSQEETDELIAMMGNGQGFAALRAITGKLGSLGADDTFSIDVNELRALARGLDVSENAMKKLAALMNGRESAEVNGKALESLLAPLSEELSTIRTEREKIARELKEVIDTALRNKKIREATDPVADTRGSQKTDRAETRMRDDLMFRAKNILTPEEEEKMLSSQEDNAAFARQQNTRDQNAREFATAAEAQKSDSKRTVFARVSEESGASSSRREGSAALTDKIDAAFGMTAPDAASGAAPKQAATAVQSNRQAIFSQVEQGMLKQLADGSRQMTLRLDPAELGQLTLLISVKGGEVRATIRAENAETTTLLSEQMSQLKATLEEQGLKVAQLDVETQLPNDTTQDNFSGMDMFNREQEMREQARFTRLAKLRRESGESLAQDVQSRNAEEAISPSGLHIVA